MHCRPTTVYTTTVKGTKIKRVNMSSMYFFLSLGWVRPEHFVDISSNIFSPEGRIILLRRCPSFLRMGGETDSDVLFLIYTSPMAVGVENNSPPEQWVAQWFFRSEEHTSELQHLNLVCP